MADFRSILSVKVGAVEKPKPLPQGTYLVLITGHELGEAGKNKTPRCRFNVKPIAAQADVDEELLAEVGGAETISKTKLRADFWLTDDALYRLSEFLVEVCGLDCAEQSMQAALAETTNLQLLAHVTHRLSQDGKDTFLEIDSFSKVD